MTSVRDPAPGRGSPAPSRSGARPRATTPAAIVVGLDSMTGLQTARVFAERGIPVVALAADRRHFCCRTRVCDEIIEVDTKGDALLEELTRVASRLHERAVLVPCTDHSVLTISRNRDAVAESFHFALPDADVVELLVDKVAFYRHAERQALPIPRTLVLENADDVAAAAAALEYPVLVKPPLRTPRWEAATRVKAYRVDSASELADVYEATRAWADVLLAQEWIDGTDADLYSCNCYYGTAGHPLATFVTRKLRQWPPRTGTGTLGVEWQNDVVLAESLRLFDGVGFRGLGYVEFKQDRRTGQHLIIEPNIGRPTGRSAIAEAGGVEMLLTMYCDVLGRPLPERREQRYIGTKWIDHRRDFQAAAYAWRHGDLGIRQWARSWSVPHASAVFSARDPLPFGAELWQSGGKVAALLAPSRSSGRPRHELTHSRLTRVASSRHRLTLEPFPLDERGANEWDQLAARTRNVFATREWLTSWWRHCGRGRRLLLTAARDGSGRLVALLPVYVAVERPVRVGRFLGHGAGDELGPICASHDRAATAEALQELLGEAGIDVMLAEQVPAAWGDLLDGRVLRREGSPVLRFGGLGWEAVLAGFSTNLRQQVRRFERRLARDHEIAYRLARGDELEHDLDDLFRLHALRWSEAQSGFATGQRAFQRDFAAVAAERGWLRLWFLEADGSRVAAWYGFRFGDVESYYQAGRDPAWERLSVGFVLLAHTLRAAAEDGVEEYRFLRGGENFKYRFANADPGLDTVGVASGWLGSAALLGTSAIPRRLHSSALLRLG